MGNTRFGELAAVLALILAVSGCGNSRGNGRQYGYSAKDTRGNHTVVLIREARPQPRLTGSPALDHYLTSHGVDCPNFETGVSWGTDDPWVGTCSRKSWDEEPLGPLSLYELRLFMSSAEKLDYVRGTVFGCDKKTALAGRHEFWIEGPNWYVAVYDTEQADEAANEASSRDLSVAMAGATGARLYQAC
jgi:hypothetical protein